MNKPLFNNKTILILGVLGILSIMTFLMIIALVYKGYVHNYQMDQLSNAANYMNALLAPVISFVSAILVYLAFRQQVEQNKIQTDRFESEQSINRIDRDFDRYIKLIEDIEKSESRIKVTLYHDEKVEKPEFGNAGVDLFISFMSADYMEDFNLNLDEAEKTLSVYFASISFILAGIESFKGIHDEFYNILKTKFMFSTPLLYNQLWQLEKLESRITEDRRSINGINLYDNILRLKNALETIL